MDEGTRLVVVTVGLSVVMFVFLSSPLRAVMYVIAFQKLIDIFWFISFNVGPIKLTIQRAVYTFLPIILIPILFYEASRKKIVMKMPLLQALIIAFIVYYAFASLRGFSYFQDYAIEWFLKIFSGLVMFSVGWFYFNEEKKYDDFAKLYTILYLIPFLGIILQMTGVFTLANIGIEQQTESQTGLERLTGAESTTRYPGFYNDGGTNVMYTFTMIPMCLYFINTEEKPKILYYAFLFIGLFCVVISFTRGMYLMTAGLLMAWWWINKNYRAMLLAFLGILAVGFGSEFLQNFFSDLFKSVEEGKLVGISGKAMRMEILIDSFWALDFAQKIFGMGITANFAAIGQVTGRGLDTTESDVYAYLYDLGLLGWGMYSAIMLTSLLICVRNIKQCELRKYDKKIAMKYKVWFAMMICAFITFTASGSRWVSFTFPLWFLAGFVLKPPSYYKMQDELKEKFVEINPRLTLQSS